MYILLLPSMNESKKRRGAPTKAVIADKTVLIRVTTEQRERWRIAARKEGLSLSAWVKKKCEDS